jgi:hypothetical protein
MSTAAHRHLEQSKIYYNTHYITQKAAEGGPLRDIILESAHLGTHGATIAYKAIICKYKCA